MKLASTLLVLLLALPASALAQNHQTLRIARPVAVGAAGTGLHASNRIYRAYPGIRYEIHADAVGGRWPYTYALSGAPAGMTIEPGPCTTIGPECRAGTITWDNPTLGTTPAITVTIRDANNEEVTGTWSINVTDTIGADGFCFLSPSGNDLTGDGSLATPYRSIAGAFASCGARSILYLRAGTYTIDPAIEDGSNPGDCDRRVDWRETSQGVIWIAYPGETPVIDFESNGTPEPCIQVQGENIWIDGLELANIGSIGFKLNLRNGGFGAVVRNVDAHDLTYGRDGSNSSFFLWTRCDDCPTWFDTVQNSRFTRVGTQACSLKVYGVQHGIFETSAYVTSLSEEGNIALKGTVPRYTVRGNTCAADVPTCIGGNMATANSCGGFCELTGGEILHNLVLGSGTGVSEGTVAIGVAKVTPIAPTWIYRNTFIGQVTASMITAEDGPYAFTNNVIINGGGAGGCPQGISCYQVSDATRVTSIDDLWGLASAGIVDGNGQLLGTYRDMWLGQRGYELADGPPIGTPPAAPTNLTVQ